MKNNPFFSIVIPTLNEEVYLPLLLEDLSKQTFSNFEVIHIDGNSNDKTVNKAASFKEKIQIETLSTKIRNVSHQRNMGINAAHGEWIIFMDADNRIPEYFLDGIKYKLAKNQNTDLFTTWVSIDRDKTLNKPIERTLNFSLELGKIAKKEWSFGALIGVKRSVLENKKYWFDPNQKIVEDGIFVKNLADNGYKFTVFKDPKYTYSIRRLDSEGTIKIARTGARIVINYLQGKDFSEQDFGYKMEGGSSYKIYPLFDRFNLQEFIKSGTKKQLEQAKNLFKSLTKFDF